MNAAPLWKSAKLIAAVGLSAMTVGCASAEASLSNMAANPAEGSRNPAANHIYGSCRWASNPGMLTYQAENGDRFQVTSYGYSATQYSPVQAGGANIIASINDGNVLVTASFDNDSSRLTIQEVAPLNRHAGAPSADELLKEDSYPFRTAARRAFGAYYGGGYMPVNLCKEGEQLERFYGRYFAPHGNAHKVAPPAP